jgi:hypothetical protein
MIDPRDSDPALSEHRASCDECTVYTQQLLHFESRLERALGVRMPGHAEAAAESAAEAQAAGAEAGARPGAGPLASDRVVPLRRNSPQRVAGAPYRKSWLAMAASMLLAVVVAGGLWLSDPDPSLAAAVVTHMAGEPQAWQRTDVPVPTAVLQDVLRNAKLRLGADAGLVSYAASCEFRGYRVPHLVLQTESGPVTVMVLVNERIRKSVQFDEQGYRGVILPVAGHGSLAVLTRGPAINMKTVELVASRVLGSIDWMT